MICPTCCIPNIFRVDVLPWDPCVDLSMSESNDICVLDVNQSKEKSEASVYTYLVCFLSPLKLTFCDYFTDILSNNLVFNKVPV
jgi:hypothetical protein